MKRCTLCIFLFLSISAFAQEPSFVGEWSNTISEISGIKNRIVFRIEASDNHYYVRGKTITIVDSEEQGPSYHAPYTVKAVSNNSLVVTQPYSFDYEEIYGDGYYTITFILKGPYLTATKTYTGKSYKRPGGKVVREASSAVCEWNMFPLSKRVETLELYKNDGW